MTNTVWKSWEERVIIYFFYWKRYNQVNPELSNCQKGQWPMSIVQRNDKWHWFKAEVWLSKLQYKWLTETKITLTSDEMQWQELESKTRAWKVRVSGFVNNPFQKYRQGLCGWVSQRRLEFDKVHGLKCRGKCPLVYGDGKREWPGRKGEPRWREKRGGGSGLPIRFGEQEEEEEEEEEEQLAEGKWGGGHTGAPPLSCRWPPLLATTTHQPTRIWVTTLRVIARKHQRIIACILNWLSFYQAIIEQVQTQH